MYGPPGQRGPDGDRGYKGDRGQSGYLVCRWMFFIFERKNKYLLFLGY